MRPSAQDVYIGEGRVFCQCNGKKFYKEIATIVQSVAQNVEA